MRSHVAAPLLGDVIHIESPELWADRAGLRFRRSRQEDTDMAVLASQLTMRKRSVYERIVKPLVDVASATLLLILLMPMLAVVALSIRIVMGKGILYRQVRVGRHGAPFEVLKFRSMRHDQRVSAHIPIPRDRRTTHKAEADPRHTPLGRFLRRLSLDELPQLWNVVRGDMSLVGPRPELPHVVAGYRYEWQHARHTVKPGVTGLWQISARGHLPMHEAVHLDLLYASHLDLGMDMRILLRTIPALVQRQGT